MTKFVGINAHENIAEIQRIFDQHEVIKWDIRSDPHRGFYVFIEYREAAPS